MSRRARSTTSDGAIDASNDISRQPGQGRVVELVGGAHRGVLPRELRAEEQRVVRAQRDRRARREQLGERHRGEVGVDAERDVGDRAHLERHPGLHDAVEQLGVLGTAYAVPEPSRAEAVQALADVLGAAQLAAVRHQQQPGALGDPERAGEVARAAAALVVGQPEADDAATGVLPGEPRERARVEGVPGAVGRDHDRDAEPGALGGVADAVEDQVGELGDPAEPGRVAAGVDLDLQPPPAVAHVVLGRLQHETAYVVGRAQHGSRHVVEALEAEPALLVGRAQLRGPVLDQRVGKHDPVALGELEERPVAHGAGEVEVEVGLRQGRHVAVPLDPICHASTLPRLGSTALAPSPYASRLVDPPDASACP